MTTPTNSRKGPLEPTNQDLQYRGLTDEQKRQIDHAAEGDGVDPMNQNGRTPENSQPHCLKPWLSV
jgi:hypothetical protein